MRPQRRRVRLSLSAYTDTNRICSITFCTRNQQPLFANPDMARAMSESLRRTCALNGVVLHAFCVMPDHVHVVASPSHRCDIVQLVGRIKAHGTRALRDLGTPRELWQRSFWDHFVRTNEDLPRVVAYVLENPVRAGLVADRNDYPFSGCSAA